MSATPGPNLGLQSGWTQGEDGWDVSPNFQLLDAVVQLTVIGLLAAPPASPNDGDRYIVISPASGTWAGKENSIAVWSNTASAWSFVTPKAGWAAYNVTVSKTYRYTVTQSIGSWVADSIAASTLEALTDVKISSIADAQYLIWSAAQGAWVNATIAGGGGISDAPSDGSTYARKNGAWVTFTSGGGVTTYAALTDVDYSTAPTDGQVPTYNAATSKWKFATPVGEAPDDGMPYARSNSSWEQISNIAEAPEDGTNYARNNGAWVRFTIPAAGIADAPSDTNAYWRKGQAWAIPAYAGLSDVDLSTAPTSGQVPTWNGTKWKPATVGSGSPYDFVMFYPGSPANGAKALRVQPARAMTFANGFAGSYASAGTAPTAAAVFGVSVAGTQIGTVNFAAGAATGTFTTTGTLTVAAGAIVQVTLTSATDSTLADVSITLAGTRQ